MNSKHATVRVLATATLILVTVGVSGSGTSASYAFGDYSTRTARLAVVRSNPVLMPSDPEAIYEGARVVHNVTVDGIKGMRVHAKFRVRYGKGVPCMMIAYFHYDDPASTPLKSGNPKYQDKKGNVSVHSNFTPAYDPALYEDLELFVPYDALNRLLARGQTYQLKFYLALYDKEGGRFFGKSGFYKFTLTRH